MIRPDSIREQLSRLERWLQEPEHISEFKEARDGYSFEKLKEYCVGIANDGGGRIIFGVTDRQPRSVVGTKAFLAPEKIEADICRDFGYRFDFEEISHPDGRVLVFHIPPHPFGCPLSVDGRFLRRAGESLVRMEAAEVARLTRQDFDFSSSICQSATYSDLNPTAVGAFEALLQGKSPSLIRSGLSSTQILSDYDLIVDGKLTFASLLLCGSSAALAKYLPQAELIFEFRSEESAIRHEQRINFRSGFLLWYRDLWQTIDLRNGIQFVQDGFVNRSIRTFTESVVREAVLNAFSHRDYQLASSIFVRQGTKTLEVVSPGGFPAGITAETALNRQHPRNRRLAECLEKCGLIERSGQGVDLMFNTSLREGKEGPDFTASNDHEVRLVLRGDIQNPQFVRFLEKVGSESGVKFNTEDLIVLDRISRGEPISTDQKSRLDRLVEEGVIERIGRGRGVKLLLSERFYTYLGRSGLYTAKLGLDRSTNKALLLQHIQRSGVRGAASVELQHVLPSTSRAMIKSLLRELRNENEVIMRGAKRGARWHSKAVENGT